MRRLLFSLLTLAALCGGVCAQFSVLPGFPPGVFQDRGALDGGSAPANNTAIDGYARSASGPDANPNSATLTTVMSGDDIIVYAPVNGYNSGVDTISVADTAGNTFTFRANGTFGTGGSPTSGGSNDIWEFHAHASGILSADVITVTVTPGVGVGYMEVAAFGISGSNHTFDANAAVPAYSTSGVVTISTSNANDMLYLCYRIGGSIAAPSGFTQIGVLDYGACYYQKVTSIQSGLMITNPEVNNGIVVDALESD